ncbi:MAG: sigma-70 family RNA polymerase sigma factor [Cyanobacteria bacterium K_DeepCast_35m_m2_023]|nr:sigma-70 family RNA polymerase sigma factor [Cyanobacteria bacterium K_DeepCast_35m_m2_023]
MALSTATAAAPANASTRSAAAPRPGNHQDLGKLHRCRNPRTRLALRNKLVLNNLGLVHKVAASQCGKGQLSFDDLVSVGSIGLIKAIESFDPNRGVSLSSYAVPFIRGAMQHEERDRFQPIKTPRRLRELQQRAWSLQCKRQQQGLAPLGEGALASALGCRLEQLREAHCVRQALRLRSLDAPLSDAPAGEGALTLLDLVSNAVACRCA